MLNSRMFLFLCLILAVCLSLPDVAVSAASRPASRPAGRPSDRPAPGQASDETRASAKPAPTATAKSVPTRITADGMTYEADALQVTFTKNVHVTRPDFEMWADKIVVHLKPAKQKQAEEGAAPVAADSLAAGDIERIVATGKVRMKRDKNTSTSGKATYTMDTAVLVLEDDPRLTDGENVITGEVVRYFMNENRSDVLSGPKKRVEAVFTTSGSTREGGR